MKIVYFSPHPNIYLNIPAGPGVHIREMIRGFEQEGHEVTPLIMGGVDAQESSGGGTQTKGLKERIKPLIPNILWQSLKDRQLFAFDDHASAELKALCEKVKPDLIYERAYYGMTSGVRVAKELGIRHVLEMNAPYPEERVDMEGRSMGTSKAKKAEKQQLKDTDRVVVVSSALKEYVNNVVPGTEAKTIITPNAIRSDFEAPHQSHIDKTKQELGLEGKTVVGFVGSIFPYHGVDQLIEAFAETCAKQDDKALLVVGDGAILDGLKTLADSLGIGEQVRFTGKIPHAKVFAHIGAMDICVMATSNWYGSPVKIFEYGAMGKTVIAPDVSPVTDVMENDKHGLLVQPNTPNIASALAKCINDQITASTMAEQWKTKVLTEHRWQAMAAKVLNSLNGNDIQV
ncbi:glycosyltransferase family 4 protein [Sanyastnella coralliicola]|uniref:glycosyltransferase family 4 protein n=1 Tax=Sanyastnella coralliicola TaxID=3069118 RepID=UPI0027B8D919|nr:glycosyltransferase family 4 protein [Longitalea sp. SCSIO 12813]